jgi:predicted PurR-regulated permease PerM
MASTRPSGTKRITALQVLATIALAGLLAWGVVQFLERIPYMIVILIAAIFLEYIIRPSVRWLNQRMHIVFAILIVYLIVAIVIALAVWFLIPPLVTDAAKFIRALPLLVDQIQKTIETTRLPPEIRDYLSNLPAEIINFVRQYGFTAAHQVANYIFSAAAVIGAIIVVPILTAYILLDQENLVRVFLGFFPERTRPKAKAVMLDLDHVLGGFIRGQIFDAIVVGVLIFILLLIFNVPYAYLVAVISAVFQLIPYFGAIVAFFPAVTLAFVAHGSGSAIGVAIGVIVVHQLDGNLVAPRIMRDNVGLSPFWVIVSVLAFTELFGFVGTFVAVPAAAMIRVMKMHFLPDPVEREEAEPTAHDEELRVKEDIANVDGI